MELPSALSWHFYVEAWWSWANVLIKVQKKSSDIWKKWSIYWRAGSGLNVWGRPLRWHLPALLLTSASAPSLLSTKSWESSTNIFYWVLCLSWRIKYLNYNYYTPSNMSMTQGYKYHIRDNFIPTECSWISADPFLKPFPLQKLFKGVFQTDELFHPLITALQMLHLHLPRVPTSKCRQQNSPTRFLSTKQTSFGIIHVKKVDI